MEEDSFKGRVDKIFGSLSSSSSSSSSSSQSSFSPSSSLWSLTDDEVERQQWNRRKDNPDLDDQTPCSSSFQGLFFKDRKVTAKRSRNKLQDPSDDEDEDDDSSKRGDNDNDKDEEWNIRSSIGLDCTLDNEEEEDAFDKMAEGRENVGDRVYMKDVTDHGPYLNSHYVLVPTSEDDSAENFPSNNYASSIKLKEDETGPIMIEKDGSNPVRDVQEPHVIKREDGTKVKPILKRKIDTAMKSSKRVKFNTIGQDEKLEPSEKYEETLEGPSSAGTKGQNEDSTPIRGKVPDYLLNPSNYTRYSFDSSDINEESNIRACMDLLGHVNRSNASALLENKSEDISVGHKSMVFIPRKKATDCKQIDGNSDGKSNQSVTQATPAVAVKIQVDEVNDMEEDTAATCTNATFQKGGRRYRIKSGVEESSS